MDTPLTTDRLIIRDWTIEDAEDALAIYGTHDVARWLTPAMEQVGDLAAMRSVLQAWAETQPNLPPPRGRWAVQRKTDGKVVGGLGIRLLPPYDSDLEMSWQLAPEAWGQGYGTEAAHALAAWAFTQEADELFAVARPGNTRAVAMARRLGMEWVGETTKYYGLSLQVYRLRRSDLGGGLI
ncbi:GNAT family N-acetyltransferase [Kitasatospora sp. LaBMicrA B282]|uniref:GNAT family N-acetyltransferase n=1 Tax=Kitasatospora sp. LaBMicrA B282 TaxID=3420949 RepID=UPI003D1384F9